MMMIPSRALLCHARLGLLTVPKTTICASNINSMLRTTPSRLSIRINPTFQLPIRQYTTRHLSPTALHLLQSPNSSKNYSTSTSTTTNITTPFISQSQSQPILLLDKSQLPPICPGCGASSQTKDPGAPGFYDLERGRRKAVTMKEKKTNKRERWEEEEAWGMSLKRLMEELKGRDGWGGKEVQGKGVEVEGYGSKEVESIKGREGKVVEGKEVEGKEAEGNSQGEADEIIIFEPESSSIEEGDRNSTEDQNSSTLGPSDAQSVQVDQSENTTEPLEESLSKSKSMEGVEFLDEDGEQLGLDEEKFEFNITDTPLNVSPSPDAPQSAIKDTTPPTSPPDFPSTATKAPICERCRSLTHQYTGTPLPAYPDLDSLVELIGESKHQKNHIYHLIDAVDFPLSLIPRLRSYLVEYLPPAKARYLTISYIVTRADLIMPQAEQVTSLMTYLKNTLKQALPIGESIEDHFSHRGGIFRVLSIKNGWSVNKIKAEFSDIAGSKLSKAEKSKIKDREGAIWIVGKVNVGKSRFVGEIVPAGSYTKLQRVVEDVSGPRASYKYEATTEEEGEMQAMLTNVKRREKQKNPNATRDVLDKVMEEAKNRVQKKAFEEDELPFVSPVVSHLPGTTAAPLRVVFREPSEKNRKGAVRGEIIDLPGMERGRFLEFVRPELRKLVLMEKRVDPAEYVVKPGQSLLLAGLILIEPKTPDTDFLMYPYSKLPPHVTNTDKALKLMKHPDPAKFPKPVLYQNAPDPNNLTRSKSTNNDHDENSNTIEGDWDTPFEGQAAVPNGEQINNSVEGQAATIDGEQINKDAIDDFSLDWKDEAIPTSLPSHIKSAGTYPLSHDVTRIRNPKLQGKSNAQIELLPYKIYSTDILLEGIGWVEIVAQVRNQQLMEDIIPEVEVFSPLGKGIGSRAPMGADMLRMIGLKEIGKYNIRRKPTRGKKRESMKGRKKEAKRKFREATGQRW